MKQTFWSTQTSENQEKYIKLLRILGRLSALFSENKAPYLYYRVHEKLFCDVFNAYDLSRGDISFDAKYNSLGIGLKTFLHQNGNTYQKIAEFNADSNILRGLNTDKDLIFEIVNLRNTRLQKTLNITDTDSMLYSLVTRDQGVFYISEYSMEFINLDGIKNIKTNKNTVHFNDGNHQYSYSKSKSTLLKKFIISEDKIVTKIPIEIIKNPFELLEELSFVHGINLDDNYIGEVIFLPLYSPGTGKVEEGSGLNQWNAGGRLRHEDEVYIPIPKFIHKDYPTFFNYKNAETPSFKVELPNGCEMICKVCQSGGKALMSNPNKELGKWILRDILQISPKTLVTTKMLNKIGIDSVKLTKLEEGRYKLDFSNIGSFEEFKKNTKSLKAK